jgi:hypothetical protein
MHNQINTIIYIYIKYNWTNNKNTLKQYRTHKMHAFYKQTIWSIYLSIYIYICRNEYKCI